MVWREHREVYEWRTGKISRPAVHLSTARNLFGKKVLLRGPDVFYRFSFPADDTGDLIETFRREQPPSVLPSAAPV